MEKIKVLLVEDEPTLAMIIKDTLDGNEFDITLAANGEEGLSRYAEIKPDIIVADIMMPKMDGIAAVGRIKEIDDNARIIMCSSMGYQEKVVDAITAGAKDFIIKPYEAEKVIKSVKAVLKLDKE